MTELNKTQTETVKLQNFPTNGKTELKEDGSTFFVFVIFFLFIFVFWHKSNPSGSRNNGYQDQRNTILDPQEKKLADRIRMLEHNLRSIALKKRELENELRKIEMDSLMDDKSTPYDTELKTDKLRMKIEDIELTEEKKETELHDAKKQLEELSF